MKCAYQDCLVNLLKKRASFKLSSYGVRIHPRYGALLKITKGTPSCELRCELAFLWELFCRTLLKMLISRQRNLRRTRKNSSKLAIGVLPNKNRGVHYGKQCLRRDRCYHCFIFDRQSDRQQGVPDNHGLYLRVLRKLFPRSKGFFLTHSNWRTQNTERERICAPTKQPSSFVSSIAPSPSGDQNTLASQMIPQLNSYRYHKWKRLVPFIRL